jgi:RimJ/RimL family protein N-acetyltransferase
MRRATRRGDAARELAEWGNVCRRAGYALPMLRGERVGLRAVGPDDVRVFVEELNNDVEVMIVASGGYWRPQSYAAAERRFAKDAEDPPEDRIGFAVEELSTSKLAGQAQLWGVDSHNRTGHLGYSLLPACRGRGLGKDAIAVLCDYGFRVRGLHRLQIDTLASNGASRGAAEANGFVLEGQLRCSAWVGGAFEDEVVYGMLVDEWRARRPR